MISYNGFQPLFGCDEISGEMHNAEIMQNAEN